MKLSLFLQKEILPITNELIKTNNELNTLVTYKMFENEKMARELAAKADIVE